MSSRQNLNDNTSDRYKFTVGGLDYDFVYPTLEEIQPVSNLYREREEAEKDDTPEGVKKLEELDTKLTDTIYSMVVPVGHTTPIKDTLEKQPFPVVKAFNKMMAKLLSSDD